MAANQPATTTPTQQNPTPVQQNPFVNLNNEQVALELENALHVSDVVRATAVFAEMRQRMNTDQAMLQTLQNVVTRSQTQTLKAQQRVTQMQSGSGVHSANSLQQSVKLERPPAFDGTPAKLNNFKFQVEQYCKVVGLKDPIKRQQLASSLFEGKALTWWRTQCHQSGKGLYGVDLITTMNDTELFKELSTAFRDVDHENRLRQRIMHVRQTHSVQQYIAVFRNLMVDLGNDAPQESDLIYLFVQGLKPQVQLHVRLARPTSLQQAEEVAESTDSALYMTTHRQSGLPSWQNKGKGNKVKGKIYPAAYNGPMPMDLDFAQQMQPAQQGNGKNGGNKNQHQKGKQSAGPPKKKQIVCFRCGKVGHMQRDCRVRLNHVVQAKAGSEVDDLKQQMAVMMRSFEELKAQKVEFLVDSGASHNFVSAKLLARLGLVSHAGGSVRVRLADRSVVHTNQFIRVMVSFGKVQAFLHFTVLDVDCPNILGMPFLKCTNPTINWQTCQVTFTTCGSTSGVSGGNTGVARSPNRFQCLELEPTGATTCNSNQTEDITRNDLAAGLPRHLCGNHASLPHSALVDRGQGVQGQSSVVAKAQQQQCVATKQSDSLIRNFGQNQYAAFVKAVGKPLSFDQMLEALPFEAVDDCVDCGGVEHCARQLKQQVMDLRNLTNLRCTACGVAHLCDARCVRKHVCGGKTCGQRFARVEENLVSNPLSRYYDLVLRVRSSELESIQHGAQYSGEQAEFHKQHSSMYNAAQNEPSGEHFQQSLSSIQFKQENDSSKQPVSKPVVEPVQRGVSAPGGSADVSDDMAHCGSDSGRCCGVEHVSLQQFKRGFKKNQYLEVFFCNLAQVDTIGNQELNFTHRAGYGTQGHGDLKVDNQQLAADTLAELKHDFSAVFSEPTFPVDRPPTFQHRIVLKDDTLDPPRKKLYPLDADELQELKKAVDELLESGRIVHSSSPYGAPILFAKKKDGRLRMCIDYRALNNNTVLDRYPLPRIDELLQRLDGAKVFSKLDLRDGYHQLPMAKEDRYKTAFCTRYGQFEFTVMPFGLCNAPATFQRAMHQMLFELLDKCVLVYIDDILIYSKTIAEHKQHLRKVFEILNKFDFKLKEKKCALFLKSVEFLGYTVTPDGLHVEQGKIDVVKEWPVPKTVNQVQQFLGMCNYYRRFVSNFATLAAPLTLLTRKDVAWVWDEPQKRAFEALKHVLTSAPLLVLFHQSRPTRVCCDASLTCVGGVIEQQMPDGLWHPCEYFSKRLNSAQCNYSATERELLAVIMCLERWRHFLIGIEFVVFTDHVSLTYLHSQAKLSRRQARWLDFLSQFKFVFEHVQGKLNVVPDMLSRPPVAECNALITLNDQPLVFNTIRRRQEAALQVDDQFAALHRRSLEDGGGHAEHAQVHGKHGGGNTRGKLWDIRQGVLCRLVDDVYVPVLPSSDRDLVDAVCAELHSSALGGHLSVRKMYALCRTRFWWHSMRSDINMFCKRCATCQAQKSATQAPSGLLVPLSVPERPFECVSMDFVTSLPLTDRGFDAIFVVVDKFSKMVQLIPCVTQVDAATCARLFFENWICKFGMPTRIICDRDPRFTSNFWQGLMRCLDCRLAMSTAYHPQTDGQTERFNRSIEQVIRCSIGTSQHDWDLVLSQVAFALNSTVHAGTATSAFECVFGFGPRLPIDTALSRLTDSKVQAVTDFVNTRNQVQQQVKHNLEKYNQQMKVQANKHRRHMQLDVGASVWLSTRNLQLPSGLSRKLAARWIGPYKVLEQIGQVAYKLELPKELSALHPVFHISLLKPVEGTVEPR